MSQPDLFTAAAEERLRSRAPLAARMRPQTLDDIVGQSHLVGKGCALRVLIERDALTSVILWGPPGTGKTTLAEVIARATSRQFHRVSAVTSGVRDLRDVIEQSRRLLGEQGVSSIVFVDEIHRFSKSQQDALLPAVEDGSITLVGATTENPMFQVNAPLRSRSTLFRLEPLSHVDIDKLLSRGLEVLRVSADADALELLSSRCVGDARQALTSLEVAAAISGADEITVAHAEAALSTSALRYGRDDHYDVISAFIKSVRGSDVDASIHWLARMLEAGEDPRFIARRLVILASEDIGEADPMALVVATAASQAVELVGLPEGQLNLAQAVVHLAKAPKSNAVARAIWAARQDVSEGRVGEVPAHLRDAHYQSAGSLGHGVGYVSPHDDPHATQQYSPESIRGTSYYREGDISDEK